MNHEKDIYGMVLFVRAKKIKLVNKHGQMKTNPWPLTMTEVEKGAGYEQVESIQWDGDGVLAFEW